MLLNKPLAFLIIFLIKAMLLQAQLNQDDFSFIRQKKEMSQSSPTTIYEDSHGFIWAGTMNGLNKFDGTNSIDYKKSGDGLTGLNDGLVTSMFEATDTLYITTGKGLNIYDRALDVIKPYPFKNEGLKITSSTIQNINKDGEYLWLGSFSDGLFQYNTNTGALKHLLVNNSLTVGRHINQIERTTRIDENTLLVVSGTAIIVINNNLEVVARKNTTEEITATMQKGKHDFILGTDQGSLLEIHISNSSIVTTKRKVLCPGFRIMDIEKDRENRIWIATENQGIYICSDRIETLHHLKHNFGNPNGLPGNSVWSLLCSKNGVMWIGTFKKGMSFYDSKRYKFEHIQVEPFAKSSLNNNIIHCFKEDQKGNLWIGTDGGGLNYWDRASNSYEHYSLNDENFGSNVVLSLLQVDENTLWAGTWDDGIIVFDVTTKEYEILNTENSSLASNSIFSLHKDKKGRVWVVSYFGHIQVYDLQTNTHQNIIIKSEVDGAKISTLRRILEDQDNNFWIGSITSGLFRLTENNDRWDIRHYHSMHAKRKISNDIVNTIIQDSIGTIWVGTEAGLNRYSAEADSFEYFGKADGLKNESIKGIIVDKGDDLWLSTGEGVTKYNSTTNKAINYATCDGLQANEFNPSAVHITKKGEFLFGGGEGFNIFKPKDIHKRTDTPQLYISSLKIFNNQVYPNDTFGVLEKAISQTDSLTLSYDHSVVNFEFQTITFGHSEGVNYAYFLEGFETDWNYVGNTSKATYTNLSPGDYKLRIKSTNSDGIWNDNEKQLAITVVPPFWQTWWFRLLIISMILAITYLVYYVRVRNARAYQTKLEREINERTHELQQQQNKLIATADKLSIKNEEIQRFTYALSHDLKSPLTNIVMLADFIAEDLDLEKRPEINQYLDYIRDACGTLQSLIADITQIAKLGKIENKIECVDTKLIIQKAVDLIIARFKEKNVELIVKPNLPVISGDRNRFIQVFENLIDNGIKYMGDQKKPRIQIDWDIIDDILQFRVMDNGSGMDENALTHLFTPFKRFDANTKGTGLGLYMIKKIIESHDGTITATSEGKGKGATFTLSFPKSTCSSKYEQQLI